MKTVIFLIIALSSAKAFAWEPEEEMDRPTAPTQEYRAPVSSGYQTYGNTTYRTDSDGGGATYQTYGNMTYGSDGTVIQRYGNQTYVTHGRYGQQR